MNARDGEAAPVELRGLYKTYRNGTRANRDISLSVRRGELPGILGPNCAGKTTLVRQITTELMPTSGEVQVFGINAVAHPNRVKGLMGVMPAGGQPLLSAVGAPSPANLRQAAGSPAPGGVRPRRGVAIRSRPRGARRQGRRRLLLGIAALADPPLMVLDEPSAGLDPEARRALWELLRSYRHRGASVLLTTNYMDEAEALCDRVGIIQDGRLLALDTIANLRADHGFEYKTVYEWDDRIRTVYGADDASLVRQAQSKGIREYAISRTTLEDVYLGLTGGEERITAGDER